MEHRILAALGGLGAALTATAAAIAGVDLGATDVTQNMKVAGFIMGAVGSGISIWVTYYIAAIRTGQPPPAP